MTEGQRVTAAAARDPGAGASGGPVADARPAPAGHLPPSPAAPPVPSSPSQAPAPQAWAAQAPPPPPQPPSPQATPAEAPPVHAPPVQPPRVGPPPVQAPAPQAPSGQAPPAKAPVAPPAQAPVAEPAKDEEIEPHVRVDARLLESAILALRKPVVAASLPLEVPGVEEARQERRNLLSQIDDYLLPRLRESGAPILVALVGSTGAGKSTLVNSIVGSHVSMTGIRRPTTNSPVLACHPD